MRVIPRPRLFASLICAALIVSATSVSQAGVIPWLYDAVFGPVRYPAYGCGYSPYSHAYARPVVIRSGRGCVSRSCGFVNSGCGPAGSTTGMAYYVQPSRCGPCGGWTPVAFAQTNGHCQVGCGVASRPNLAGCSPKLDPDVTPAGGTEGWKESVSTKKNGEATVPVESPRETFSPNKSNTATDDRLGTETRTRGTRPADETPNATDVVKPGQSDEEPVIRAKKKAPPVDNFDELFEKPRDANKGKPSGDAGTEGSSPGAAFRLPSLPANLDGQLGWRVELPRTRLRFHAKTVNATVARTSPSSAGEGTPVPASRGFTQFAKK